MAELTDKFKFILNIKDKFEEVFILLALLLLIAVFGLAADNFLSSTTLFSILSQLPALTVITIGMTLVLIGGGIDLSVGSVAALSGAVVGFAASSLEAPLILAGILAVAAAGLAGFVNGILGSHLKLPVFIVTLGMLEAARGAAYLISDSQTVYIGPSIQAFALPIDGLGLSSSFLVAITLVILAHFAVTRTVFGQFLIAIGTNEQAARISGIKPEPILASALVISGVLAGLGGVMNTAYLGAADPNAALGLELSAIAAAVIGGTSLMGGRGSIVGAFLGVLIICVLQNGLAQLGVSEPFKRLMTGLVIILAVLLDKWRD
ncbi:MAG: ABC transporter permease [Actinobacteria bacterium]|nr:ABC transporter permease [Actinomycetota bacterium]